ncbi:P-loop containing nucleoside triphosphate hydrolase protein [Microstroma glucosiphilum]|uniref:P-loop containing nucleoside triphosphate hydrolase protein n=1 Tax=Pseudomicrostroma glucosiphilum TaxID=1684307 RepID=A0A316U2D1_9BASI|nr:P-loop containing nucleoside triphosphate hydrolase protein [Pseudomicrostroma glucosiphilum]PWN18573.1 P-loop containing nucleoside triphosphate hydrolase protein [Pseudomicrostroma glucosiphilum]
MMLCDNDAAWGPGSSCRSLDFTIHFEQSILLVLPNAIFIAAAFLTVLYTIYARPQKAAPSTRASLLYLAKQLLAVTTIVAAIISLATLPGPSAAWPRSTVLASRCLTLISALLAIPVIDCLHARVDGVPHRPRTRLIGSYFFQLLGHATFLRTSHIVGIRRSDFVVEIILAVLLGTSLLLESTGTLIPLEHTETTTAFNPEDRWGLLGTTSLAWMYPMLISGMRRPLEWSNLYPLQAHLDASSANEKLTAQWQGQNSYPPPSTGPATVGPALRFMAKFARAFPLVFLAPILPRIIYLVTELLQPLAIDRMVDFVSDEGSIDAQRPWALVAGVSLLYLVLAASNAVFYYHVNRAVLAFRAAAVSTIFQRMIEEETFATDSDSSSAPVSPATLMSVDIERVVEALQLVHDLWAAFPTMGVSFWLLYQRVGLAVVPCIGTIVLTLTTTSVLARPIAARQKRWSDATAERVDFTSSFLLNLKSITLGCYQSYFQRRSSSLRSAETEAVKGYYARLLLIATLAISASLNTTFVTFASAWALAKAGLIEQLTTASIFSALAIIQIIGGPLASIGQQAPVVFGATSSMARIGEYLDRGAAREREKAREHAMPSSVSIICSAIDQHVGKQSSASSIRVVHLVGGGATGKTTALRSVLQRYRQKFSIAYAAQRTALFESASIRDNIKFALSAGAAQGANRSDEADPRLAACITLCCLDKDIQGLDEGIDTPISTLSGGQKQRVALARALYSHAPLLVLDDVVSAQDAITAATILHNLYIAPSPILSGRLMLYASHSINRYDGSGGTFLARRDGDQVFTIESLQLDQIAAISAAQALSLNTGNSKESTVGESDAPRSSAMVNEAPHSSRLGLRPYRFFLTLSPRLGVTVFVVTSLMAVGCHFGLRFVLQQWASLTPAGSLPQPGLYIPLMAAILLGANVTLFVSLQAHMVGTSPTTGLRIHNRCMATVLSSVKAIEFSPHQVINRFARDLFIVDYEFPLALLDTFINGLVIVAELATLVAALPVFGAVIPVIVAAVYLVQLLYLRSSRQVRSMELESQTSLFALFSDVANVRDTIQSLHITKNFSRRCHAILDHTQQPFYARLSMLRFLRVSLFILTWLITTIVASLAVRLRASISPALLGLALANITQLSGDLKYSVMSYTNLETSAVAVDRLRKLVGEAESQGHEQVGDATDLLPLIDPGRSATALKFSDVSMRYNSTSSLTLRGVSFSIPRNSRTGICGRSGSGKSSLMMTMLRGVPDELCGGVRSLYGSLADQTSLEGWRRRFSYVPQEPVVWKGTIRSLLTLSEDKGEGAIHPDVNLWEVLDAVDLGDRVRAAPEGLEAMYGALQKMEKQAENSQRNAAESSASASASAAAATATAAAATSSGPTTVYLSRGETQLLAFARVLLERDRPILLLDEATSSLDEEAEKIVTDVVMHHPLLAERTVVAISHRIAFIANFDQIVLLDSGRVREAGDPKVLMQQDSAFGQLAKLQEVGSE